MRKTLLTFCTGIVFTLFINANNADLFTYDAAYIDQELGQLQLLENYIYTNPGITLAGLQAEESMLVQGINLSKYYLPGFDRDDPGVKAQEDGEPPLGIPSFLWGCVGGIYGILIVYLVSDSKEQTEKAVKGCVVSRLVGCVIYVAIYALIIAGYFGAFSSYYWWY
jgi:hypothetical protein